MIVNIIDSKYRLKRKYHNKTIVNIVLDDMFYSSENVKAWNQNLIMISYVYFNLQSVILKLKKTSFPEEGVKHSYCYGIQRNV